MSARIDAQSLHSVIASENMELVLLFTKQDMIVYNLKDAEYNEENKGDEFY